MYILSYVYPNVRAVSQKDTTLQHCLLKMLEKSKSAVDKRKSFVKPLTDLPKAFDFLLRDLLLAKLHAYEFRLFALTSIHSYLKNWKKELKLTQHMVLGNKYFSRHLRTLAS